jgi:hypothetical protein
MQQLGDPLELRHRAMAALQGSDDTLTLLSERLPTLQRNASVRPNPGYPLGLGSAAAAVQHPRTRTLRAVAFVLEGPRFSPAVSRVC